MNEKKDLVMVICPPLSKYKEAPSDQSECEESDCPECGNGMWLSEKKKLVLLISLQMEKDIFMACYDCAEKFIEKNIALHDKLKMVKI